jgi:hypothetical protein
MAHPRTYSDTDPHLDELRRICLELPEVTEVEAWGRPTFRAGKKMFAMFVHHDGHGFAVAFKPDAAEQPALGGDPRVLRTAISRPLRMAGARSHRRAGGLD